MQTLYPVHQKTFAALFFLLLSGCISHAGAPYPADQDRWLELAEDACRRGDERAFDTLKVRAGERDGEVQCLPRIMIIAPPKPSPKYRSKSADHNQSSIFRT